MLLAPVDDEVGVSTAIAVNFRVRWFVGQSQVPHRGLCIAAALAGAGFEQPDRGKPTDVFIPPDNFQHGVVVVERGYLETRVRCRHG